MTAPSSLSSICVFAGSAEGHSPIGRNHAQELGRLLADLKLRLVYGGGSAGLMGLLARAALGGGGEVVGVIPKRIRDMIVPFELTETIIVEDMHARKSMMYELSDAFLAMPGGIGTLEELLEILTWQQLGYHRKPVGLLNSNHYFDPLLNLLDHMVQSGFLNPNHYRSLLVAETPSEIVNCLLHEKVQYFDKYGNLGR